MAFKILKPWTLARHAKQHWTPEDVVDALRRLAAAGKIDKYERVREPATLNVSLSEIVGMLTQSDATTMDRNEIGSPASIDKITWQKAGHVTEPGRYMFRFGWLTVTDDDLAIWRQFPNTTFTLVRTANEAEEAYRLGTFELPGSG